MSHLEYLISGMDSVRKYLDVWGGTQKIYMYIYIYFYAHPLLRGFNNLLILEGSHRYTQPLVYHVVGMAHLPKKMGDGPKPDLVDPPKENKEAKFKDQTRTKRKAVLKLPQNDCF